jgi:4-hydroxythreonine-4-phosphate dehydrogenase
VIELAGRNRQASLVVFADVGLLERAARRLGRSVSFDDNSRNPSCDAGRLTVHHIALACDEQPGILDTRNADYVLQTLSAAAHGCLHGNYAGLVTGPVQKSVLNEAGFTFTGHTEFFRDKAGVADVVMLLVAGKLRVGLATTHLPLKEVPAAVTRSLLTRRLGILLSGLETLFAISAPRVLVAGLNPHAGESGYLGREEIEVITPVCDEFREAGVDLVGPLPADTLFTPDVLSGADAVFAMFHDQGLPVLKYSGFGEAVNVTLGLPFVRTSVDHGTALDLAGTGKARVGSLVAATSLASQIARGLSGGVQ